MIDPKQRHLIALGNIVDVVGYNGKLHSGNLSLPLFIEEGGWTGSYLKGD
jgi:hypothetical protein